MSIVRDYEGKLTANTLRIITKWFYTLWVHRHGTTNIMNANPWHRVLWTDMITDFPELTIHDRPQLQWHIDRTLKRLRKHYPDAGW